MDTATAYTTLRNILENGYPETIPLRWQSEDEDSQGNTDLPDIPATFLFSEFFVYRADVVGFGAGLGNNRYRNYATLDVYAFVPKGYGASYALFYAETAASLFRSFRDDDLICRSVTVSPGGSGSTIRPDGLSSEVDNYYYASVVVDVTFDQVG